MPSAAILAPVIPFPREAKSHNLPGAPAGRCPRRAPDHPPHPPREIVRRRRGLANPRPNDTPARRNGRQLSPAFSRDREPPRADRFVSPFQAHGPRARSASGKRHACNMQGGRPSPPLPSCAGAAMIRSHSCKAKQSVSSCLSIRDGWMDHGWWI